MSSLKRFLPIATQLLGRIPVTKKTNITVPSYSDFYRQVVADQHDQFDLPDEVISPQVTLSLPEAQPEPERQVNPDVTSGKGTACLPCSNNHLHACKGLLDEAVRFAQTDGLASEEVIKRIDGCMGEIVAAERIDLSSESIMGLPQEQREIAQETRQQLREIRHGLEHLGSPNDLEEVTAKVAALQHKVSREWFLSRLSPDQREVLKQKTKALIDSQIG